MMLKAPPLWWRRVVRDVLNAFRAVLLCVAVKIWFSCGRGCWNVTQRRRVRCCKVPAFITDLKNRCCNFSADFLLSCLRSGLESRLGFESKLRHSFVGRSTHEKWAAFASGRLFLLFVFVDLRPKTSVPLNSGWFDYTKTSRHDACFDQRVFDEILPSRKSGVYLCSHFA